jgi:hypothetical protein
MAASVVASLGDRYRENTIELMVEKLENFDGETKIFDDPFVQMSLVLLHGNMSLCRLWFASCRQHASMWDINIIVRPYRFLYFFHKIFKTDPMLHDLFLPSCPSKVRTNIASHILTIKIGTIPMNLYGVNGAVSEFIRNTYGTPAQLEEEKLIMDYAQARYVFAEIVAVHNFIKVDADFSMESIDRDKIRQSLLQLILREEDYFDLRKNKLVKNPESRQLFVNLHHFYENRGGMWEMLVDIAATPFERMARIRTLSLFDGGPLSPLELMRLALETVFSEPVRQEMGVGSCFAAAALINVQANEPWLMMRFLRDMLCDWAVTATDGAGHTVTVPANPYEKKDSRLNGAQILHYAMARTIADVTVTIGARVLHASSESFHTLVEELKASLMAIGFPNAADLIYEPPSYDSSEVVRTIGTDFTYGSWIPHIGFPGDTVLRPLTDNTREGILSVIEGKVDALQKSRGRLSKSDSEAFALVKVRLSSLRAAHIKIQTANVGPLPTGNDFHEEAIHIDTGGWVQFSMRAFGKTMHTHPASPGNCSSAAEVFCKWWNVMKDPSFHEAFKILVHGKGHEYNLTPGKSKELSEALKSPTATPQQFLDTVLKDHRGSYVIFADPNYGSTKGIAIQNIAPSGFRCFLDGMFDVRQGRNTYERYGLVKVCEDDSIIQLSPRENEEFFTDLMAFTD